MSNELLNALLIIGLIAFVFLVLRWITRKMIRDALAEEGFETTATFAEVGEQRTLTAVDEHGRVLVARVKMKPSNLTVRIKGVVVPVAWNEYNWMELSNGTRLSATPV